MNRRNYTSGILAILLATVLGLSPAWAKGPPPGRGGGGGGGGKQEKVDHTARQSRPISMGVSGGTIVSLSNGFCCSGTLGALVEDDNGTQYLLSNYHVFAGDSTPGGNGKIARVGDPINQPGYIDVQCDDIPEDYVATLSNWIPLNPGGITFVDAAIAEVVPGAVLTSGEILEIGQIASDTAAAYLDQPVKKSGRTSGLTRGKVAALNATVSVTYEDECAGDTFTTTYVGQVIVTPGKFIKGGDSGSVMVEDVASNPRAVGLLYAGSRRVAVANPIDDVLDAFGVGMVGTAAAATGGTSPSGGSIPAAALAQADQARQTGAPALMRVPGAVGHAVGLSSGGSRAVIKVLVEEITSAAQRALPRDINGVPVELMAVGHITAY